NDAARGIAVDSLGEACVTGGTTSGNFPFAPGQPPARNQDAFVTLLNASGNNLVRSEEHTSELQSPCKLVSRLLLEKKNVRSRGLLKFRQVKLVAAEGRADRSVVWHFRREGISCLLLVARPCTLALRGRFVVLIRSR